MTGSIDGIRKKVVQIPFYTVAQAPEGINIVRVESRDIRKKPFLFYIVNIRPEGMTLTYSIAPDTSEKLRRAYVMKNVASVLSVISDSFSIDEIKFYQFIDSVMDNLLNSLSQNVSALYNKYDALLSESRELKRLASELSAANRNLTIQTAQLSNQNKELSQQLNALQIYSDDSLMAMIDDWLEVHNSAIDVNEFATTYKITPPRVEQVLNKMVSLGYIELKS